MEAVYMLWPFSENSSHEKWAAMIVIQVYNDENVFCAY